IGHCFFLVRSAQQNHSGRRGVSRLMRLSFSIASPFGRDRPMRKFSSLFFNSLEFSFWISSLSNTRNGGSGGAFRPRRRGAHATVARGFWRPRNAYPSATPKYFRRLVAILRSPCRAFWRNSFGANLARLSRLKPTLQ